MDVFGWDDLAMSTMLIFNTCQQAILYYFLYFGAGLHLTEVMLCHPEWLPLLLKGLLVEEFYYIWMQFSIKMCFLLFYFRLSSIPSFKNALYGVIGFHTATTILIWLLYGFQCIPLTAFYDPASYLEVICLNTDITYFVPYTLNMTTDIFILLLPLSVIGTLNMPLKRRLSVLAVVTTGGSAVLISGLRAILIFEFATSPDFTWALGKMVIISSVEIQVGILAANMPSLKAFYTCWRKDKLGRGQGADLAYSRSKSRNSRKQGDLEFSGDINSISQASGERGVAEDRRGSIYDMKREETIRKKQAAH
ncbi:hypothetical protein BJ170DRAFT_677357 [Xylariales sp. AK1849]|nr:hypothetical protein BJ170DRAFT_677357 [Xylariales sp. AK1849]